ncbi:MAG TPA: N-acetylmuramoyl-L-alanine amidase, partial [Gaiellaceae bacterium]|nr:N-acetylmuramoyl-L-alanine amidase [Gaiellaceae bacterium]
MKWVTALAVAAALAVPAAARAGDVTMRVEQLPAGPRTLEAAKPESHFNMLAFKWTGNGTVDFRVRSLRGRWSAWQLADDDVMWVGASRALQVRRHGGVDRLWAYELWSRVTSAPPRALAAASQPAILTRAQWGANEEIVRAKPVYASALKLAVVHHTVTPNTYTRAQAAAIVRGIEFFHVRGNGWNDIGYNFLVDRFGTVYEGRGGGVDRNVVGAHAAGFNTGTVGVSLLGTFQTVAPSRAMQSGLVKLLAWRLDVAHVDPLSTVVYTSGGNPKFRRGKLVTLRVVSGHRDTGPTECPGADAYRLLPSLARRIAATGLPKLYAPVAAGALGGPIHFQARLSSTQPWTVTVADASGTTVAAGSGRSKLVAWTWQAPPGPGGYSWTIAVPGARPATGTLGNVSPPPPPSLTGVTVEPGVAAPAADGTIVPPTVSYALAIPATVTASIVDATGATVRSFSLGLRPAGRRTVRFDAGPLADGRYQVVVSASAGGTSITRAAAFVVDRTVAGLAPTPGAFSPNGDLAFDSTTFSFLLAAPALVRLEIRSGDAVVAAPFSALLPA